MRRLAALALLTAAAAGRADQFDYYTHPVLTQAENDGSLKTVKELSSAQLSTYGGALPDSPSAFLVVVTNDKRFAKLLVQPARQKLGADKSAPLLLVDKYTTFKGTGDRAIQATGQNLNVYSGLRLSLDLGQVVPEAVGGDLTVVADPKDATARGPTKGRELTSWQSNPRRKPKKAPKLVVGERSKPRFVAGRPAGRRRPAVRHAEAGGDRAERSAGRSSDKDGRGTTCRARRGRRSTRSRSRSYPATTQTFTGYVFTGDARAIAGTTKMPSREAGFCAAGGD